MQSLLQRGKAFLTPSASTDSLVSSHSNAKGPANLFSTVDPAVDGPDCLHDCSTCTVSYPSKFSIDESDALYGHVKGWSTHLLVATGKTDWVRDVADEKGSVMEAAGKHGLHVKNGKVMLSACNMPVNENSWDNCEDEERQGQEGTTRCLLLPAWKIVDRVMVKDVPEFLEQVVAESVTNVSPMVMPKEVKKNGCAAVNGIKDEEEEISEAEPQPQANGHTEDSDLPDVSALTMNGNESKQINGTSPSSISIPPEMYRKFSMRQCPHRAVILMCSQKTRDARCGQSAPILRKEFERHLRPLGLYRDMHDERPGGVGIYFISHVGGHKYSANVMIYRREGRKLAGTAEEIDGPSLSDEAVQGIWLARVKPEDCENIIKFTVLQGKVVKPGSQLRGGFDRQLGMTSW